MPGRIWCEGEIKLEKAGGVKYKKKKWKINYFSVSTITGVN